MTRLVHDAARLVGERHTVVYAPGELWVLLLKDSCQFDEVGTTAQMAGLGEIAIGEDVTGAQMNEMGATGKLLRQVDNLVVGTCRQTACTEGETIMLVGYSLQEPTDILFRADDTRESQNLDRRVVGMYAHIHITLLADGHNRLKEIFHILT